MQLISPNCFRIGNDDSLVQTDSELEESASPSELTAETARTEKNSPIDTPTGEQPVSPK